MLCFRRASEQYFSFQKPPFHAWTIFAFPEANKTQQHCATEVQACPPPPTCEVTGACPFPGVWAGTEEADLENFGRLGWDGPSLKTAWRRGNPHLKVAIAGERHHLPLFPYCSCGKVEPASDCCYCSVTKSCLTVARQAPLSTGFSRQEY